MKINLLRAARRFQALTQRHSGCTSDGRHYLQLELVNVRTLADATQLWAMEDVR